MSTAYVMPPEVKRRYIQDSSSALFAYYKDFDSCDLRCMKIFIDDEFKRREQIAVEVKPVLAIAGGAE